MKKIVVLTCICLFILSFVGTAFASIFEEEENAIVKRHREWKKKVMGSQYANREIRSDDPQPILIKLADGIDPIIHNPAFPDYPGVTYLYNPGFPAHPGEQALVRTEYSERRP